MRNTKFLSCLGAIVLVAGTFLLPGTANASGWSVNIGIPVMVAAPAPAVVYSPPVAPVVTVVPGVPVAYSYVSGHAAKRYPSHHYSRGRYHARRGYHHGHR